MLGENFLGKFGRSKVPVYMEEFRKPHLYAEQDAQKRPEKTLNFHLGLIDHSTRTAVSLIQGSANYGLWAKSGPLPLFIRPAS